MGETTAMRTAGGATDSHGWIMSESLRALGRGGKNAGSWRLGEMRRKTRKNKRLGHICVVRVTGGNVTIASGCLFSCAVKSCCSTGHILSCCCDFDMT